MSENKKLKKPVKAFLTLGIACASVLGIVGVSKVVSAYLTDAKKEDNILVLGEVDGEIEENFDPPEELVDGDNEFTKQIRIRSTGSAPMYTRVSIEFSNSRIEKLSTVTADGTNYYPLSELKDHLNDGWVYNEEDGYYYYTKFLETDEVTTPLIEMVKTTFPKKSDVEAYDILVSAQCVAASKIGLSTADEDIMSYTEAWKAALSKTLSD